MDSMRLAQHRADVVAKYAKLILYCKKYGRRGVALRPGELGKLRSKKISLVVLDPNRSSHTLTSLPDDLIHYSEPRILTVREYARLQSFPDWFVFRGKYTTGGHMRVTECPRYTQVGNAVAPFVSEALGAMLSALLKEIRSLHEEAQAARIRKIAA
jgi:DNA (cytosine-5)-methyltransferase 1